MSLAIKFIPNNLIFYLISILTSIIILTLFIFIQFHMIRLVHTTCLPPPTFQTKLYLLLIIINVQDPRHVIAPTKLRTQCHACPARFK